MKGQRAVELHIRVPRAEEEPQPSARRNMQSDLRENMSAMETNSARHCKAAAN